MRRFVPISIDRLAAELARHCQSLENGSHPVRMCLDAPRCADLTGLVACLVTELASNGHPVAVLDAQTFYRDASVRLEYGKHDVEAFYGNWLDTAALQREVLSPLGPSGSGLYLPSLRDPHTNRSTRARPERLGSRGVLIVLGELLLGAGLSFDLAVHVEISRLNRRRQYLERLPDWAWTLAAFDRYEIEVDPAAIADVVVRLDDPRHPAFSVAS